MYNPIRLTNNNLISQGYIKNDSWDHNQYIVVHNDNAGEYVDSLLFNINLWDYLKNKYLNSFGSVNILAKKINLKQFDMFYINGFLALKYNQNMLYNVCNIERFIQEYGEYFGYDLRNNLIRIYNEIENEIEILYNLRELYSDK